MDVIGFLQKYDVSFEPTGKNVKAGWVGVCCPYCGDTGYHGGFNLNSGGWSCWKCRHVKKRTTRTVIQTLTNVSWNEVSEIMLNFFKGFGSTGKLIDTAIEKIPFVLPGTLPMKQMTLDYISNRNFDVDAVTAQYGLLCGGYEGDYAYRVIVPVWYNNQIVSFQTRGIFDSVTPRYKDCSKKMARIYHKNILFNLDNCRENWCILVEGVFDVFRIGNNCCCPFGIGYTTAQVVLLSDLFDIIFVWFDPGEEAQEAAKNIGAELAALGTTVIIMPVPGNDPGATDPEEVLEIMYKVQIKLREEMLNYA